MAIVVARIARAAQTDLMKACARGDLASAKSLLLEARSLDADTGQGPLHSLALAENTVVSKDASEWVRVLSGAGCDVDLRDGDGYSALLWAAQRNNLAVARALIAAGATTNVRSKTEAISPLLAAAQSGNTKMIRLLLGAGADPNQVSTRGISSLVAAVSRGDTAAPTVKALIDGGIDVNLRTKELGISALHVAAQEGHVKLAKLLAKRGKVNVNVLNEAGISPLMLASAKGHVKIVQLLLDEGADVDYKVEWDLGGEEGQDAGDTWDDDEDEEEGVPRVKERTFINALSMAQSYEHEGIVELLERHMDL
jgi:ankyrin repeat protein